MIGKKTALEAGIIVLTSLLIGFFYNYSNPSKLPFIGEEKKIDFSQSDSLLNALHLHDSLQKYADSISNISLWREDSLKLIKEKRTKDSLRIVREDSLKRVNDSLTLVQDSKEDTLKKVKENIKPIDIKLDFAKALYDRKYTFLDARDVHDYRAGHILGAINIPFHNFDEHKNKLESLNKENVYICYCSLSCDVSIDLAYAMVKMGFKKVYIFHGGWDEWKKAGYPSAG
jgi:rhodanese-related sulfurtransferase